MLYCLLDVKCDNETFINVSLFPLTISLLFLFFSSSVSFFFLFFFWIRFASLLDLPQLISTDEQIVRQPIGQLGGPWSRRIDWRRWRRFDERFRYVISVLFINMHMGHSLFRPFDDIANQTAVNNCFCIFQTLLWFAALAALAGSQLRSGGGGNQSGAPQQSQEMAVPNELIGCIIGKGGTKIAEIRWVLHLLFFPQSSDGLVYHRRRFCLKIFYLKFAWLIPNCAFIEKLDKVMIKLPFFWSSLEGC